MRFERRWRRAGLVLGVSLALAGCGSGDTEGATAAPDDSNTATIADETSAPANDTPATDTPATDTPATEAAAPDEPGPICDGVPSLEVVSAIVGEAVHSAEDNSTPTVVIEGQTSIDQRCDLSGDGVGSAIFERWDTATGDDVLAQITADGLVQDIEVPGLPDAVAWANGIMVQHEGLYWLTSAITPDTVGVMDAPGAYEASAALMLEWLGR